MDPDQFADVYRAHARDLWGYALRRSSDPEDAIDVVAETFLVAWRRDDRPPPEELRAWLFGVARRVLANQHRGRRRRARLDGRAAEVIRVAIEDSTIEASELAVSVDQALRDLDPDDLELLRLTSWEQLTPTEIAHMLDLPAATVRTRLHRARRRAAVALRAAGFDVASEESTDA